MRRVDLTAIGTTVMALGVVALLTAILLPDSWLRDGDWSKEDALAFQSASSEVHALSLSSDRSLEHRQRVREATEKLGDLEIQRSDSAGSADRRRSAIRWTGGGLCLTGLVLALIGRGRRAG